MSRRIGVIHISEVHVSISQHFWWYSHLRTQRRSGLSRMRWAVSDAAELQNSYVAAHQARHSLAHAAFAQIWLMSGPGDSALRTFQCHYGYTVCRLRQVWDRAADPAMEHLEWEVRTSNILTLQSVEAGLR